MFHSSAKGQVWVHLWKCVFPPRASREVNTASEMGFQEWQDSFPHQRKCPLRLIPLLEVQEIAAKVTIFPERCYLNESQIFSMNLGTFWEEGLPGRRAHPECLAVLWSLRSAGIFRPCLRRLFPPSGEAFMETFLVVMAQVGHREEVVADSGRWAY